MCSSSRIRRSWYSRIQNCPLRPRMASFRAVNPSRPRPRRVESPCALRGDGRGSASHTTHGAGSAPGQSGRRFTDQRGVGPRGEPPLNSGVLPGRPPAAGELCRPGGRRSLAWASLCTVAWSANHGDTRRRNTRNEPEHGRIPPAPMTPTTTASPEGDRTFAEATSPGCSGYRRRPGPIHVRPSGSRRSASVVGTRARPEGRTARFRPARMALAFRAVNTFQLFTTSPSGKPLSCFTRRWTWFGITPTHGAGSAPGQSDERFRRPTRRAVETCAVERRGERSRACLSSLW